MRAFARSSFALALAFTVPIFSAFSVACDKKEEVKTDRSQTTSKTEAVPTDFVLNPFLPDDKQAKVAVQVRSDGGAPAIPTGAGAGSGAPPSGEPPAEAAEETKVTEPGAEPRAERKYTFTPGKAETRIAIIKDSISQGGQTQEQPPIKATLAVTVKDKTANGAHVEVKVTKLEIVATNEADKALAAQAGAALGAVVGLAGLVEVTTHGQKGEMQFAAPQGGKGAQLAQQIIPLLQQSIELLYIPLPAAPIGVGAKWESRSKQGGQGVDIKVVSSFTLKSWTAELGEVDATITKSAPKQAMPDPRAPPGSTMAVEGKATFAWTFRLDKPAQKVSGDDTTTTTVSVPAGLKGPGQSVVQVMKIKQTLESP